MTYLDKFFVVLLGINAVDVFHVMVSDEGLDASVDVTKLPELLVDSLESTFW